MRNFGFAKSWVLPSFFLVAMLCGQLLGQAQEPEPAVKPMRVRASQGVAKANLIKKVTPIYPEDARSLHGSVLINAVIGKDGTVQQLTLVSGHPLLAASAMDAVKQWKYKPYLLNGEPVEVETQITINFAGH